MHAPLPEPLSARPSDRRPATVNSLPSGVRRDPAPAAKSPANSPAAAGSADAPANSPPATHEVRQLTLADREATLARAAGTADARVQAWLANDVASALHMRKGFGRADDEDRICAALSAMCDIGPRDILEGMLAAQMVAVHSAALDCLRRAVTAAERSDPVSAALAAGLAAGGRALSGRTAADQARDAALHHAARLLHVFERQLRLRDDRRNPALARSLTGSHAPDAPGRPAPRHVEPAPPAEVDAAPDSMPDALSGAAPEPACRRRAAAAAAPAAGPEGAPDRRRDRAR